MCAGSIWSMQHEAGKRAQSWLLLISFKLFPQVPFLASKSSANVVNAFEAMTVSLSQKAAEDVCTGLLSVFNTRLVIQITSAEQWPNANIPVNFSIPDLSTCLIPFQLGSAAFRSVTRQGLRREENHGTHYQARFGVLFWLWGEGGCGSCSWGSSSCLACPFVFLMTWPRKVSHSIQEALRVILPDDGHFPCH